MRERALYLLTSARVDTVHYDTRHTHSTRWRCDQYSCSRRSLSIHSFAASGVCASKRTFSPERSSTISNTLLPLDTCATSGASSTSVAPVIAPITVFFGFNFLPRTATMSRKSTNPVHSSRFREPRAKSLLIKVSSSLKSVAEPLTSMCSGGRGVCALRGREENKFPEYREVD